MDDDAGAKSHRGDDRPTTRIDALASGPSWDVVLASLEQLATWATLALRLGTLALVQECVRELAQRDARAAVVDRLRELVEVLAHMPYEK